MLLTTRYLYFIFIFAIIGFGCEKEALITYSVINKSTQGIKVVFYNTDGKDRATYEKRDSVFIEINAEKKIVIQRKGLSRVSNYKETETNLREFKYFEVYQQTIKSKTDFLLSSKWHYTENNKHSAEYKCTVNEADF